MPPSCPPPTPALPPQLEARVREALGRADASETAAQAAEGRARAAEAAVAREVEDRLRAAASNRALWPVRARLPHPPARVRVYQTATAAHSSFRISGLL